jgi:hypothetical protein
MQSSNPRALRFATQPFVMGAVLSLASATALVAGQAHAQTTPTPVATPSAADHEVAATAFKRADKNADGKLSKEEAAAMPAVAARFDEFDQDKDGSLSLEEFTRAISAP